MKNSNSIANQRFIQVMDVRIAVMVMAIMCIDYSIQNSKIQQNFSDHSLPYPDFSSHNTKHSTEQSKFQSIQ